MEANDVAGKAGELLIGDAQIYYFWQLTSHKPLFSVGLLADTDLFGDVFLLLGSYYVSMTMKCVQMSDPYI